MADLVSYHTAEDQGESHPEFVADETRSVVVIRTSKTRRDGKTEAFPLGGSGHRRLWKHPETYVDGSPTLLAYTFGSQVIVPSRAVEPVNTYPSPGKNSASFAFCFPQYVAWSIRQVVHQYRDCRVGLPLEREKRSWARHHRQEAQNDTGSPR